MAGVKISGGALFDNWSWDPRDWADAGAEWVEDTLSDSQVVIDLPSMPKTPDRIVVSPGGGGAVGPRGPAGSVAYEYDVPTWAYAAAAVALYLVLK